MPVGPSSTLRPTSKAALLFLFGVLCLALSGSVAWAGTNGQDGSADPTQIKAEDFGVSVAVRDLDAGDSSPSGHPSPRVNPLADTPGAGAGGTRSPNAGPDALTGRSQADGRTPAPGPVFDGTSNPTGCSGCTPPDTTGDVGPNHYIQMVNATKVAIYSKAGALLTPAFNLSTLFTSGSCSTGNAGDPQVLYDELADRWLLSQFTATNQLCFAVSQTPDPTGAYFTYAFTAPNFPDYFKVGVWPTGYYVGTNESPYTAYALDRTKMLSGDSSATAIRFPGQTNFLMPADVDGSAAPSPQGGLFYTFKDNLFHGGADRLELFQLTPDFATPANSTFSPTATIPVTSFTYTVCGFFVLDCIPQPATAEGLDPVSEWPMQRLAYRRFDDHEGLVGNFTVDAGSDRAGIRWFELRNTGAGYTLHQEGTQAPADGLNRWMGSIAMDVDGNIALGYSTSSSTDFPSIRYATRTPSDPLGTLQAEQVMQAGAGSQTSTGNRWGDYSAMSVDPANDCDFWFTTEYYGATSATDWKTAIGTFKEPTCPRDTTPPETTITSGPADGTTINTDSVAFGFDSNEPGSTFECSLDSAAFAACSSPKSYSSLSDGTHDFEVQATDGASNTDPTPASSSFTVDTKVRGSASASKKQKQKGKKIVVKAKVKADEDLRAKATGKVKVKKKTYKLKPQTEAVGSGQSKTLKLKPKKSKDAKKIAKALKKGKKAKAKLTVKLTDDAGNKKTTKLSIKLKR
ncbi:MAG: hypothetical protein WBF18_00200 [Solirubrobacterales bacterium]